MALRNFTNPEMITVSRTWADPAHADHQVLLGQPTIAPLLPQLIAIHRELVGAEPSAELLERLAAIQGEQGVTDDRHDVFMRGMNLRFQAEILLASDPGVAAAIRGLRQLILPRGLVMVNATFREEVGHAESVAAKLTPEHEQLLRRLGTHEGTMLDVVRGWLAAADQLGHLDHERRGIEVEISGPGQNETREMRNRWIRMIELIRRAAEFVTDDPALADLLARVARAENEADRRVAARRNRNAEDPDPGPDPELEPGPAIQPVADEEVEVTPEAEAEAVA